MKKDKRIIYILLIVIIIFSAILIYKINKIPKYDEKLYEEVYKEYEEINLQSSKKEENIKSENNTVTKKNVIYITKNASGIAYRTIATINIPKINVRSPIINEYTEEYLKIAPTKLVGPEPNEIGNFVIVGHNYRNEECFSNLSKLEIGDSIELTDRNKGKVEYKVYDKYEIQQSNFECINQNTEGKIELTLITCVKYNKNKRLVVKCIAG